MSKRGLTVKKAVTQVFEELSEPISKKELVERVLAIRPSKAKNPAASIMDAVRGLDIAVRLEPSVYAPASYVFDGLRFRFVPNEELVRQGLLLPDYTGHFRPFLRRDVRDPLDATWLDDQGRRATEVERVLLKVTGWFGAKELSIEMRVPSLARWFRETGFQPGDSILVTILSFDKARFRLEREPAAEKRHDLVIEQNRRLADAIFAQLRGSPAPAGEAVAYAYAQLWEFKDNYPGDHWIDVVQEDCRMETDGALVIAPVGRLGPLGSLRSTLGLGPRKAEAEEEEIIERYEASLRQLEAQLSADIDDYLARKHALDAESEYQDQRPAYKPVSRRKAIRRSENLIEAFLKDLAQHKNLSHKTLEEKGTALKLVAEYAAQEGYPLDQVSFPQLETFFFWWAPRKVLFFSPTMVRQTFTALRQFYAYLAREGKIPDDGFMRAFYRYRDLAVELLNLYERLIPDFDRFEELSARLFEITPC